MENSLKIFSNNEFGKIRVAMTNNEPYFNLKDVCRILGIINTNDAKSRLLTKGVVTTDTLTKGGKQKMLYINEPNLYKLIFQSRKPNAEKFTNWVTSEVLPTIRKYGMYAKDELLDDPELLSAVIEKLKEEKNKRIQLQFENNSLKDTNKQLEKDNKQLTDKTREQEPLVELSKTLLKATNAIRFGEMAKMLKTNGVNIGRNRLTRFLKKQKILTENLTPYQQYMDKEYFYVYQTIIGGKTVVGTHINPQGQLFIVKLIMEKYNK